MMLEVFEKKWEDDKTADTLAHDKEMEARLKGADFGYHEKKPRNYE